MSTRAKLGFLFFMSNRNGGQPEEPSVIDFELFFFIILKIVALKKMQTVLILVITI